MTPFALPTRATRLRLLVLAISERCDQRCVHCQIWMGPQEASSRSLTRDERLAILDEAVRMGVEQVLLTGGEPLLSADLWPIAERLRGAGVEALLATNGLLLEPHAGAICGLFSEVYVSLDGASAATHDRLRGVPSLDRVTAGVRALRQRSPRPLLVARCTLHAGNLGEVEAIVDAARGIGFDHVSFLPIDAASEAFGGRAQARQALLPDAQAIDAFLGAIARLAKDDGFILESFEKLRRLATHLRASAGAARFEAPECDAPWWSSVVEADGRLRPCFFHAPLGDARHGLSASRRSEAYQGALALVRSANPTCERCVCPKRRGVPMLERLLA